MDTALLHPKLVHLPIALAILMPALTIGMAVAINRKWLPTRAWLLVVIFQGLLVGSGLLALETGEIDEEIVEAVVPESALHRHEEAAETFVWFGAVSLGLLLLPMFLRRRTGARTASFAVGSIATLGVLGMGFQVGGAGGDLVYVHGAASAHSINATATTSGQPIDDREIDSEH